MHKKIETLILKHKTKAMVRLKEVPSLSNIKTIGAICVLSSEENWNIVLEILNSFNGTMQGVCLFCISQNKALPLWIDKKQENIIFCTNKDLSLLRVPKKQLLDNFIKKDFDLLINFDINNAFLPCYVSALSKAKFKIGLDTEENRQYFDLLLNIKEPTFKEYSLQVVSYLSKINI
ncbi:MAG: hypothetical protein LBM25_00990 [Bacteroidales bacterium]|jgi:hypothetical protein|nr:hypothetical protein [Bacteroidales bacterium]